MSLVVSSVSVLVAWPGKAGPTGRGSNKMHISDLGKDTFHFDIRFTLASSFFPWGRGA